MEILEIEVGSERRKGKGRALIALLLRDMVRPGTEKVWAITRESNRIAQQFYGAVGFELLAKLCDFHGAGEHALMYGRRP